MTDRPPKLAWLDRVQVGDVLKSPSGALRVVRAVSRCRQRNRADRVYLSFAIKHCSWTTRPYTVWVSTDQYTKTLRPTGKRKTLGSRIDRLLEKSMQAQMARDCPLHCHQVRGIA